MRGTLIEDETTTYAIKFTLTKSKLFNEGITIFLEYQKLPFSFPEKELHSNKLFGAGGVDSDHGIEVGFSGAHLHGDTETL